MSLKPGIQSVITSMTADLTSKSATVYLPNVINILGNPGTGVEPLISAEMKTILTGLATHIDPSNLLKTDDTTGLGTLLETLRVTRIITYNPVTSGDNHFSTQTSSEILKKLTDLNEGVANMLLMISFAIINNDKYIAPSTNASDTRSAMPFLMQFVCLFCKNAALLFLGCKFGNVNIMNSTFKTFDADIKSAMNRTLLNLFDILSKDTKVYPTLDLHLASSKEKIEIYVDNIVQSSTTSTTTTPSSSMFNTLSSLVSTIYTPTNARTIKDLLVNSLYPWLYLEYITSFMKSNAPVSDSTFLDEWFAEYIVFISTFYLANILQNSFSARTPAQNTNFSTAPASLYSNDSVTVTVTSNQFKSIKENILNHLNSIDANSMTMLVEPALKAINDNIVSSKNLDTTNNNLEFRRQGNKVLAQYYSNVQKQAKTAKYWFYATIVIFVLVVSFAILLLMNRENSTLAIFFTLLIIAIIVGYFAVKWILSRFQKNTVP